MSLAATVHHVQMTLSDVDRNVYEHLDLRVARHPSESARYLVTRILAYCLSFEEGIVFSKAGVSSTEEPPVAVRDPTGLLLAWIDIGSPSAERLHKASKAARRVSLFTSADLGLLRREAASRTIHKIDDIEVWRFEPSFIDALEPITERNAKIELARNDGRLYVTIGSKIIEADLPKTTLVAPPAP